jgi:acyl-CoA synthetase (AMP-forming)/AMP-acid ligase II
VLPRAAGPDHQAKGASVTSVPSLIARAASWYSSQVAVEDGLLTLSFADVDERSNRLANALCGLSPEPGSRVAVLSPNRGELVEIDFAIAKAGKIRVPVNTRLKDAEREYILADSGADVLIADVAYADQARQWHESIDTLRSLILLGSGFPRAGGDYDELLAAASADPVAIARTGSDGSFILYTSGTTGRPKGATSTVAGRLAATSAMLRDELIVPPGGAMVHVGSMAHGSGSKVLAYFVRGARNIPVAKWDPEGFLRLVQERRASGTFVVPTMLADLVDVLAHRQFDLSTLTSVSYGGAPIAPAKLQEAMEAIGPSLVQVYGSCEAPHPVLVLSREDHASRRGATEELTSVGRETFRSEVRLVREDGSDAPAGEPGEMWIRGPSVMADYWRNPEATAAAITDGWYKSGDVARQDPDGYHYIVDRTRDMIISGGLNIYPAEVEAAIHRHPGVADVAVIGVPSERWGEEVKAYVVTRRDAAVTAADLIEHCRAQLAGYKKPSSVEFVAALPRGSTGKVLKRELREPYWAGRDRLV